MPIFIRFGKSLNWLFLCANILLCVILLRSWYLTFDNKTSIDTNIAESAAELGMDAYCVKGPFAIYIDKKFYQNGSYYLCQYGDPLVFLKVKTNTENSNNLRKDALFGVGKDVAVSCEYSIGNGGQVHDITLLKNDESFSDLNADGRFNTHVVLWPKEKLRLDVWYNGKWQEVDRKESEGMGKHQQVLKENGEVVIFDKQIGQWIPQTDKPETKNDTGKTGP